MGGCRFKLAIISDTHVAERAPGFNANLRAALEWVRAAKPDAVVHLGDVTADGLYDAGELELAAGLLGELECPVYVLPGNHDIGDNPPAPRRRGRHLLTHTRLRTYRKILGADRWVVRAAGWRVIGLNALLLGAGTTEEERQFAWLARQLAGASEPVGVMLHKPLFRGGPENRDTHERYVPWPARDRLLALLAESPLRFVMSGHVHQARRHRVGSVEHLWVPSTAFYIPDALQERIGEKRVGLALLELDSGEYRCEWVSPAGLVAHDLLEHPEVYPEIRRLSLPPANGAPIR